jgi:hypothetical protein
VLESGPNDKVFLNFADHGATGLIAFPKDYLYEKFKYFLILLET